MYIILYKHDTGYDGQSIYYTESKPFFDYIRGLDWSRHIPYWDGFSEELKQEMKEFIAENQEDWGTMTLEDISISDVIEALATYEAPKLPITIEGATELYASWNW